MRALPLPPRAAYTDEPIFRLTVDQYHQLIASGKLTADDPVELLEGLLVFQMPKNSPHATSTRRCRRTVEPLLPPGWFYDSQEPITLADGEPEPDGIVVRGDPDDYADRHPGPADVALVIEVSNSTLACDRGPKLRSYARAGIPASWIVNLVDQQVEVHADPDPVAAIYRSRAVLTGDTVAELVVDGHAMTGITAASLLPSARDA